ncbi:MAG TPA: phenylalanine--tRNA ligase subunit beta [Vicinamibacterales bacterium]|nr:phenylalanine--tRNA ligase subunit beta [Vicinamibacterales bacterium]
MKLLISWVRDFVDVKAPAREIAEKLGVRGFEVASVEPLEHGDGVIDFEVTANRPDCLSVIGFAREIAAAYDLTVRPPSFSPGSRVELATVPAGESDRVSVTIEDTDLCPRYAAAVVDTLPANTPAWMSSRLQAAGVRPISAIVDITNYVLMELGHPLHAFDLDALDGRQLRVRRAAQGERITTLDDVTRTLDAGVLVIADASRPQAVAGVMGGGESEVSASTKTVVFESAYFTPASIRRTSKRMGLKTEASARFERGADINAPVTALQRALALLHALGAGRHAGVIMDRYPAPRAPLTLHLRRARLALVLGMRVPDRDVERILRALGLMVTASGDGWDVVAPTFRVDLLREVDLIEEVGRHHGFDALEATFPPMTAAAPPPDARVLQDRATRRMLTASGLTEAMTFGFVEVKAAETFAPSESFVTVANPLSAKFDTMRPSLLPGLVDAVAHNRRHGRRDVALFEIGARFTRDEGERRAVGIAWTGAPAEHWSAPARDVDFYDIKGVVEQFGEALGRTFRFAPAPAPYLVPGQSAQILAGSTIVGAAGQLAPTVAESRGAPRHDSIFVAELDLDRLIALPETSGLVSVRPLPRYPFVVRDLSIVVPDALPAEVIRDTIQRAGDSGRAPLTAITFFDRYKGKGLSDGHVSVSVRLTFQHADRTLTDGDVQETVDKILAALVKQHDARQR